MPDEVAGRTVNTSVLQMPIRLLTSDGSQPAASSPKATLGTDGTTSRRQVETRDPRRPVAGRGGWVQVQRMADPLLKHVLIGPGFAELGSRSAPKDDARFAALALGPLIARLAEAACGGAFEIPRPPRHDLLPTVTDARPIAVAGTPAGPVADLLRRNVGVLPTAWSRASRLGLLGGDPAGFPNGRRPVDDVTDIVLRVVVGGVPCPASTASRTIAWATA